MLGTPHRTLISLVPPPARGGPDRGLSDARLIALARAACAPKARLRRPFLSGRWHAAHIERVAAAVAALGVAHGEITPDDLADAQVRIAERLRARLSAAPTVADGLNSLAEFLGGRAPSHPDRLRIVATDANPQPPEDAAPSAA
jgi:hypothetical protein